jgi:hypothetical protein
VLKAPDFHKGLKNKPWTASEQSKKFRQKGRQLTNIFSQYRFESCFGGLNSNLARLAVVGLSDEDKKRRQALVRVRKRHKTAF